MINNFESEFLAFCRSKPEYEKYDAGSGTDCALSQFVGSKGYNGWWIGVYSKEPRGTCVKMTWDYPAVCWKAALVSPEYTFGALVARLEQAGVK